MNTYGYVRVSTLQQANEGDSLETQLRQIKSYSELKGYSIPSENLITEKGVSGSLEFEKRPEGAKLFASLQRGDVLVFSNCAIPDDHIDPRRSAFFMARSILRDIRSGVRAC